MKKILFITIYIFLFQFVNAQNFEKADKIRGQWYTEENESIIRIYRAKNGYYYGVIHWMKEPNEKNGQPKKDVNNPDPDKRNQTIEGLVILKAFKFDGDNMYDDGNIYNPENGKTYSGYMKLVDQNTIELRGYIGRPVLGGTTTWKRKK
jgi:uncharacterized protein (DUF2147 family)